MSDSLSVAVIGGGIGGLATAASLLREGIDVHVYERAERLTEVGAGIQISPNASCVLHKLGLGDALDNVSVRPLVWHQRRWDDGRTLLRSPLAGAVDKMFGYPQYNIHRADLIDVLASKIPAERIHLGYRLADLDNRPDYVEGTFKNGLKVRADAFVGADGIHSTVRYSLFGPEKPHFTGCVAYRGLVPTERVAHHKLEIAAQVWMGPEKHFVHYFVRRGDLISFFAGIDHDDWSQESWTDRGDKNDALRAFAGWNPVVRDIIGAVDDTFVWALLDRKPMQRWSVGRTTLLGDACHGMLPFMAQGAAQAIEDGATLAACLRGVESAGVADALKRYEFYRLPRTSRIQGLATANKQRFHMPDGPAQIARDAEMGQGATDWSLKAVAWIYGYDATQPELGENQTII